MVSERLNGMRFRAIRKPAILFPEPESCAIAALQNQRYFTGYMCPSTRIRTQVDGVQLNGGAGVHGEWVASLQHLYQRFRCDDANRTRRYDGFWGSIAGK